MLGIQILWTRDAEHALKLAKNSKKIMNFTNKKFGEILRKLIAQTTLDLSKFVRVKYETLITIHVHQKDIFEDLVNFLFINLSMHKIVLCIICFFTLHLFMRYSS